jgi:mono/diheme cytochrome c family protein
MPSSMTGQSVQRTFKACAVLSLALLSASTFAKDGGTWGSGEDVYAKVCGYCHDVGVGPAIKGRHLTPAYISAWVRHGWGAMPAFSASFIDDKALQDVADYLSKSAAPRK